MSSRPNPIYDTRKHFYTGILWRGYVYEAIPQLAHVKRVMIVADHDDYLIVSDYSKHGGWHDKCVPTGPQYQAQKIGLGKPTKHRIGILQTALKERYKDELD